MKARLFAPLGAALFALPLAAEERDPASVWLPASTEMRLRLGADGVLDDYGDAFEGLQQGGGIFVLGPGTTREIQSAADRARVFLLYQQKDLDGDGQVSRTEYDEHADVTWGTDLDDTGREILEREWAQADTNDDGLIAFDELRDLALTRHPVPPDRPLTDIEQAILAMDLDNDGFVYWDEVERVLTAR